MVELANIRIPKRRLIFHALGTKDVATATLGKMASTALLAMSISCALGFAVLLITAASKQAYPPNLVFPNSGNTGLGLALPAFGGEGLKLGVLYVFMVRACQHSVGFSIAAGPVFLQATTPTAILNHIYAYQYGDHGTAVSGAIAVTTLSALLCLPALLWSALRIFGYV